MDLNVRAFRTVQAALAEQRLSINVKAARRGIVGGPSRAKSTSPQQRKEIATKASLPVEQEVYSAMAGSGREDQQ